MVVGQVSISGQALVFVVRTASWSPISRAGLFTYIAFFGAQVFTRLGLACVGYSILSTPQATFDICMYSTFACLQSY